MVSKTVVRLWRIHELKITLEDVKPAVWRRFAVPSDITLAKLHRVVQAVMGWGDYHLHQFRIKNVHYEVLMPEADQGPEIKDAAKARLDRVAPRAGASFTYDYDFGDGWEHTIKVLSIGEPQPGVRYPACFEGERACPPEDCGGPYGYVDLLDAMAHPKRKESKERLEWLGEGFDPAEFDLAEVKRRLLDAGQRSLSGPSLQI